MPPETAKLIDKIDSERERISRILRETDEQLRDAEAADQKLTRDIEETDAETEDALRTLRRAGLFVGT